MQKACQYLVLYFILANLAGCSYFQFPGVYKISVQQGNIITQKMIDQVKPGMTKRQVRFIMGTPLIADTFNQNRWDYNYSLIKPGDKTIKEKVTLFFKDDKLTHFTGDYRPSPSSEPQ